MKDIKMEISMKEIFKTARLTVKVCIHGLMGRYTMESGRME